MTEPLRAAIVGAKGIGKHHAKWFARSGCEVVAIYGTTPDSVQAAASALNDLMGFTGRAFHQWDRFVADAGFDACSVCSPAESHAQNVHSLLAAGKHVLCEKPLCWNWDYSPARIMGEAQAMVEAVERSGVVFGLNAQYPAAVRGWSELYREVFGKDPGLERGYFTMDTRGKPRSPHGPAEVWVDLAPHPIALIDRLLPGGIDYSTLRHQDGPLEVALQFDWVSGDRRVPCEVECRRTPDGQVRRLLGNQDMIAELDGINVDGEFRARLRHGDHEWVGKDFMQESVERFVEAVRRGNTSTLLVDAPAALRQQAALTGVWERCWAPAG
jgi:predicted dehydrogenase